MHKWRHIEGPRVLYMTNKHTNTQPPTYTYLVASLHNGKNSGGASFQFPHSFLADSLVGHERRLGLMKREGSRRSVANVVVALKVAHSVCDRTRTFSSNVSERRIADMPPSPMWMWFIVFVAIFVSRVVAAAAWVLFNHFTLGEIEFVRFAWEFYVCVIRDLVFFVFA